MKTKVQFFTLLAAEHFKSKGVAGIYILLLFPLFITVITDGYIIYNSISNNNPEMTVNPWISILGRYVFLFYGLLYPIIIAIACHSLVDIDYQNHNFTMLFTLPIPRKMIIAVKMVFLLEVVFLSVVISYALYMISALLLGYILPNIPFNDFDMRYLTFNYFLKLFIGVFSIACIQHLLSAVFKNFAIPIVISCLGIGFSLIGTRWSKIYALPYHSPYAAFNDYMAENVIFSNQQIFDSGYLLLSIFLIIYVFVNKRAY